MIVELFYQTLFQAVMRHFSRITAFFLLFISCFCFLQVAKSGFTTVCYKIQQNFNRNHKKMILYFSVLWYIDNIDTGLIHKIPTLPLSSPKNKKKSEENGEKPGKNY